MNIALCHFRVGETDGVSLEMAKWKTELEKMGCKVIYIGGNQYEDTEVVEELAYNHPLNKKIVKNAYDKLEDYTEKELKEQIQNMSKIIEEKVVEIIKRRNIDVIVPNNMWSLGLGLAEAIGIYNAVKRTGIKAVSHNHDFYWERDKYANPTTKYVEKILEEYFPPKDEDIKQVVINSIAQNEMHVRKSLSSTVVPNVFDFNASLWNKDEYNKDFRKSIGVKKEDILILQATRVAERKAIELAIDVIGEIVKENNIKSLKEGSLYDGRKFTGDIVFVCAGLIECEDEYLKLLKEKCKELNVKIKFVNEYVDSHRYEKNGHKVYSLWDAYVDADFITYPSILEGFGNQFLEALFAKKPMLIYEYPVYVSDLKKYGFNVVSLGDVHKVNKKGLAVVDKNIIENAAKDVIKYLKCGNYRNKMVEENFQIGKQNFSYEALGKILKNIFIF